MEQKLNILFAGPWIGEFGWELFCWQGFLRRLANEFDMVGVACRPGHELLYQDFATDIITYQPNYENTDMWRNHGEPKHTHFYKFYEGYYRVKRHKITVILNNQFQSRWWIKEPWYKRQQLVSYGSRTSVAARQTKSGYDLLLIIRNTNKCNSGFRNWELEHAGWLLEQLPKHWKVACVGKSDSALWLGGTDDLRDIPLCKLADIMRCSRAIVGPQCGVTHFATLCGLPQVCWQTRQEHATRALKAWNPFNTHVITLPSGDDKYWKKRIPWTPPTKDIIKAINKILERNNGCAAIF